MSIGTVGIVGASGYSGEVLVEILSKHPSVDGLILASRSLAGKRVADELPRLRGLVGDLTFIESKVDELLSLDVAVWFLALPHGVAAEFAVPLMNNGKVVIDLSADFRLNSRSTYQEYYGTEHPAGELLNEVPYVIPELAASEWTQANLIACPGCYPTSILMPLIPLLREGLITGEGIVINSMSGVSGAGKKATGFYSYCERTESAVAYGIGWHRHLSEIEEQLSFEADKQITVQFTPHLVPMIRGIATTIVIPSSVAVGKVYQAWEKYYKGKASVHLLPSGSGAETGHVVGKNRIDMSAVQDKRTGNIIITTAEDNLMKGAGGQAVQIMNLKLGLSEFSGLMTN